VFFFSEEHDHNGPIILPNLYPVIPLRQLAHAVYAGRNIELSQRGDSFHIVVDRFPIRSTEMARIEEVAVIRTCEPLAVKRQPRLLLEGLGLGIAVAKAEQVMAPRAKITVAEAVSEIVSWHGTFLPLLPSSTQPDHFRVSRESLATTLAANPETYDAIVLELDYAIDPFLISSRRVDDYLPAIAQLLMSLRPRGKVAIHSTKEAPPLSKALEISGFEVEHRLEAPHKRSKARHHLTIGSLPMPGNG